MKKIRALLLATTALTFLSGSAAYAADNTSDAIKALQEQVTALQKQLTAMQAKENAKTEVVAPAAAAPAPAAVATTESSAGKKEILPGVTLKFGGYLTADGVYRSHNQGTGSSSSLNTGIPYDNAAGANQDEFHLTSNATRLSVLAEGNVDKDMKIAGYLEGDFMGGSTSTVASVESNSYTPRLRHAYATVDRNDWGVHFLAGQTWSLASLYKNGLTPRTEVGPIGIDSVGAPGYVYTRAPQVRIVKDFADNKAHFGLSLEDPEINLSGLRCTNTATGTCATFPFTTTSSGAGGLAGNQSADYAPDVIAKVAYDTGFGHFEAFGLSRFFQSTYATTGNFDNQYAVGLGGGVGAYIPVIAKKLDLQANFLGGRGIGRYSAAQMPDMAFTTAGDIKPITQMVGLLGVIGHPTPTWDIYTYVGAEKAMRVDSSNTLYGYGSSSLDNSPCYTQNNSSCFAQTEMVWSITPGFWNTVYKGDYGSLKLGPNTCSHVRMRLAG